MKNRVLLIALLIGLIFIFVNQAQAFFNPFDPSIADFNESKYPEELHKTIKLSKGRSPLDLSSKEKDQIHNTYGDYLNPAGSILGEALFNTFTAGNGKVDVTFQVKNGVEIALKDTLGGYSEYQRRKITEEMLNANFRSHRITNSFLTGRNSSSLWFFRQMPNLIQTARYICNEALVNELHNFFKKIAWVLLGLMTALIIFKRLASGHLEISYVVSSPLLATIAAALGIFFIGNLLDTGLAMAEDINSRLIEKIYYSIKGDNLYENLALSWQYLANQIGYSPALVLSLIDILAQFFVYVFIVGLILSIILAKIISPFWALAFVSDSLRSNSFNSLLNWCKTLLIVILLPVSYLLLQYIASEFKDLELYFLEVALSIAGFIYLPALSSVILAKNSGILRPAFSGYYNLVESINNSYQGLISCMTSKKL